MSGIVCALNIGEDIPFGETFLFLKDGKSDLGFAFGELISFWLKKDIPMIFVNFSQSFTHYFHLLLKFGVNIKSLIDSGYVVNVDFLKMTGISFDDTLIQENKSTHPVTMITTSSKSKSLIPLFECIKESIVKLGMIVLYPPEGFVLFFDEINVLLNWGYSEQTIETFLHYCNNLCCLVSDFQGCMLVGAYDDDLDSECHHLLNHLSHRAHKRISVQGLSTGYSRGVHGKIIMENNNASGNRVQKLLFKAEDKGAKLYLMGL